jgi:hypothetical protein
MILREEAASPGASSMSPPKACAEITAWTSPLSAIQFSTDAQRGYGRCTITVLNRQGLESAACDCRVTIPLRAKAMLGTPPA